MMIIIVMIIMLMIMIILIIIIIISSIYIYIYTCISIYPSVRFSEFLRSISGWNVKCVCFMSKHGFAEGHVKSRHQTSLELNVAQCNII